MVWAYSAPVVAAEKSCLLSIHSITDTLDERLLGITKQRPLNHGRSLFCLLCCLHSIGALWLELAVCSAFPSIGKTEKMAAVPEHMLGSRC